MDATFGERLQTARKRAGLSQQALGDVIDRTGRTVRNWEAGRGVPNAADLAELRRALGSFDAAHGDPVETAVRMSTLTEDRQHLVLATYKRLLREQAADEQDRLQRCHDPGNV